jgi:hypothetical protein
MIKLKITVDHAQQDTAAAMKVQQQCARHHKTTLMSFDQQAEFKPRLDPYQREIVSKSLCLKTTSLGSPKRNEFGRKTELKRSVEEFAPK